MSIRNKRIGEKWYNKYGSELIIIDYRNTSEVDIIFTETKYIKTHCKMREIKEGTVISPYDKTVYNIGYIGEGKYSKENNELIYRKWRAMLERCYSKKLHDKYPTYIGCSVCEEWKCFQNFAKWYEENYYEVPNTKWMDLDKDILIKRNKIYSPETCIFVPHEINVIFTKADQNRGDLPIGVYWDNYHKKFVMNFSLKGKNIKRKFKTSIEAFLCYKTEKEKYIKEVADEFKPYIPQKLYEAMYNYKVEITD